MIDIALLAPALKTNQILVLAELINNSEVELKKLILETQRACSHTEKEKHWSNPSSSFDKKILLLTECKNCGLIKEKPKGFDYQICINCWTPMEDDATRLVGEDRTHFYKCPNCGNTAFHT